MLVYHIVIQQWSIKVKKKVNAAIKEGKGKEQEKRRAIQMKREEERWGKERQTKIEDRERWSEIEEREERE